MVSSISMAYRHWIAVLEPARLGARLVEGYGQLEEEWSLVFLWPTIIGLPFFS
jgi:hypothetical protein